MRRIMTVVMALSLIASATLPAFAQQKKARPALRAEVSTMPNLNEYSDQKAFTDGRGVWISWNVDIRSKVRAFDIYRISESGRWRLNDTPFVKTSGIQSYFDHDGDATSVYEIDSINSEGARSQSGRISVEYVNDLTDVAGRSSEDFSSSVPSIGNIESAELDLPQDLVSLTKSRRSLTTQRNVAAQAGVKIGIRKDGLYKVLKSELQEAGFDVSQDPAKWQLFVSGIQQAIIVEGTGAYIEFFAKSIDTIESDIRYYYLINGQSSGKRMDSRVSRRTGPEVTSSGYHQTFTQKQRKYYVYDVINGDPENYWGDIVSSTPLNVSFNINGIDLKSAIARLQVAVQGYVGPSHTVNVSVNGSPLGSFSGSALDNFTGDLSLPTGLLLEGPNTLTLSTTSSDFVLFDNLKLSFDRKFLADQNRISFYTEGIRRSDVSGFSSPNIRLFDLSSEGEPLQVTNLNIVQNGSTFDLKLPAYRSKVYYGVEDSGVFRNATVVPNFASSLATPDHSAQLVIISHGDFMAESEAWANYRRSQGISVEVVDVADIYDEFNFGTSSSKSITDFLRYAEISWQNGPSYVLLIGDASYDPRNYENFGYFNMVPSKFVNTIYLETGSDEALADFDGDGLSEIAIGRIPARTPAQVTNALTKVMRFETPAMQNINRGAIFAYDVPNGYDFAAMSHTLRDQLPSTMQSTFVGRGMPPPNEFALDPNAQTTLVNGINAGKYLVNYSGHGTTANWVNGGFFGINNFNGTAAIPQVANTNDEAIFTMLTCLNGYFFQPNYTGLAEVMLHKQNAGAVAAWASTGETTPDIQLIMGLRFFQKIGDGTIPRLGDLIRDAKTTIPGGSDVRLSWALFGDPMLKVR